MAVTIEEYLNNPTDTTRARITSEKFKQTIHVQPTNDGFVFYEVKFEKGKVPEALSGKFTTLKQAIKAVLKYEQTMKTTPTVERDKRAEKRNAAKVQRDSTE